MKYLNPSFSIVILVLFLAYIPQTNAQIFQATGNPSGDPVGNPDAIVTVGGSINNGIFTAQTPEACVQGDFINWNDYGEDPEWRFDIIVPNAALNSPVCSDVELRVCRRGDFGQTTEIMFVYDEQLTEIGNIPGHPDDDPLYDCTAAPICTIITLPPCLFNENVKDDGVFSVTLYTNGDIGSNTVGDFCGLGQSGSQGDELPPGPQADGDAVSCNSLCPTYTQSINGVFEAQNNGGPMNNVGCMGCNCAFIDYFYLPIEIIDSQFVASKEQVCLGESFTFTPNTTTCEQRWTLDGSTNNLSSTSGTTTFTPSSIGTYTICSFVGNPLCESQECKDVSVVDANITCPNSITVDACDKDELTKDGQTGLPYSIGETIIDNSLFINEGGSYSSTTNPVSISYIDQSNGGVNPEIITRTYKLQTGSGCEKECTQIITISPSPVTISCPSDITIECIDDLEAAFSSMLQFETSGGNIDTECGVESFILLSETIE